MKLSDMTLNSGQPMPYYPKLSKVLGGTTATILFCSFLRHHEDMCTSELGISKTMEEIKLETGLSHTEQTTARKKLKALGVLIETHKRLEHRIYYKIDFVALNALIAGAA